MAFVNWEKAASGLRHPLQLMAAKLQTGWIRYAQTKSGEMSYLLPVISGYEVQSKA